MTDILDVIIIGAGPAGLGMGVCLDDFGMPNYKILEKGRVGNSFFNWPKDTRFITPSFTTNGFGFPDLNSISINTSPAYTLDKERLSGLDYQRYLELLAREYDLPVIENVEVESIEKEGDVYKLTVEDEELYAKNVIMAVGEYSFYDKESIKGAQENSIHYAEVSSWADYDKSEYIVVGGNESSVDAAIELVKLGSKVKLITSSTGLNSEDPDPSVSLSPYTRQKFNQLNEAGLMDNVEIINNERVTEISHDGEKYFVKTEKGFVYETSNKPFLGIGFNVGALSLAGHLFEVDHTGKVLLTDHDESTISKGLYMIGPSVRQKDAILCYIYKFRQRFAIIAEKIAHENGIKVDDAVQYYKNNSFYLEDCASCDVVCDC